MFIGMFESISPLHLKSFVHLDEASFILCDGFHGTTIKSILSNFKFAFFKHQSIALKGKAVLILILLNLSSGEAATIFPSIISAADEMCV